MATTTYAGMQSAGNASITINQGDRVDFRNDSTAGTSNINNDGLLEFFDDSTAGQSHITTSTNGSIYFMNNSNSGNSILDDSGYLTFSGTSGAGSSTINHNSNNNIMFLVSSSAENATLNNNSGYILFSGKANAGNSTINNSAFVDFSYTSGPNGDYLISAGSIAGSGFFSLGRNQLTVGSNNLSTTVSGSIQDGGFYPNLTGASLVKVGTGTLTLSGANTYTGGTTFAAGTLNVGSAGAIGTTGTLSFNGGTLQYSAANQTDYSARFSQAANQAYSIDTNGQAITFGSPLSSNGGSLKVTGSGSLTLNTANNYTGGTLVTGGATLVANSANNINGIDALGAGTVTLDNGTLRNDTGHSIIDSIFVGSGGGTLAGNVAYTQYGSISGAGTLNFAVNTALTGDNSGFTGTSVLTNNVTLYAYNNNSFSPNSAFQIGGGTTLDLSGLNQTILSLADGPNAAGGGTVTNNGPSTATLTIGGAASTAFSGILQDGSNALSLTLGAGHTGTTTLTGANTYTGATAVNAGTLLIDGSLANTAVTVAAGAGLGGAASATAGTGTIAGTVSVSGTISAGAAALSDVGTFTTGALTLNAGSTFREDVTNNTTADHINVTGAVALSGTLDLEVAGTFATSVGQSLTLINNVGTANATTGQFSTLKINGAAVTLSGGNAFDYQGHSYLIDIRGGDGNDVVLRDVTSTGGGGGAPPTFSQPSEFGVTVTSSASPAGAVYGLYKALLGHTPDPLGLEAFAGSIQNGATPADVAAAILASPEYAARNPNPLTDSAYVSSLYTSLLNRAPDAQGQAYFQGELSAGVSRATVASQIATSTEAQNVLQPTFANGVFVTNATDAQIARLYYGILGRTPDATGLASFEAQAKGLGLAGIAQTMLSSSEFGAKFGNLSDAAYIDTLYVDALGHHADAAALSYWGNQLASQGRVPVAVQIAQSQEAQVHLVGVIEHGMQVAA